MRNVLAYASILALAISAPALAEKPDQAKDNGRGKDTSQTSGKSDKGNPGKGDAAKNRDKQAGNTKTSNSAGEKRQNDSRKSGKSEARHNDHADSAGRRNIASSQRKSDARRYDVRGDSSRFQFTNDDDRRRFAIRYDQDFGPLSGFCPPGLAKKGNGCQPPGQAKKSNMDYLSKYSRFGDGDWRYYNGYAYRIDTGSNLINSFLPLVGGALFSGNNWPAAYQDYSVPQYYDRYYGRNDNYDYRYADRAIFRVNPQDQAIEGIVALLTGDDFEVGRRMPSGYDVYNVPSQYREQYYDRPDAQYRYSDGYVYQVDPTTQLIAAAIQLIV